MKTLFFGAGPLGILYAHLLHESGADVTILARGATFKLIKTQSLGIYRHRCNLKELAANMA